MAEGFCEPHPSADDWGNLQAVENQEGRGAGASSPQEVLKNVICGEEMVLVEKAWQQPRRIVWRAHFKNAFVRDFYDGLNDAGAHCVLNDPVPVSQHQHLQSDWKKIPASESQQRQRRPQKESRTAGVVTDWTGFCILVPQQVTWWHLELDRRINPPNIEPINERNDSKASIYI